MKKTILTLALVVVALGAFAQKGQLWLGGSIGYSYDKSEMFDSKVQSLSMDPYVEYYFADTWTAYVGLQYEYRKADAMKSNTAGPFAAVVKYFPLSDKLSLYTALAAGARWGSATSNSVDYSASTYSMRITPGLNILISDRFCAYVELGDGLYFKTDTYKDKNNSGNKHTDTRFAVDLLTSGASVGVLFKLK